MEFNPAELADSDVYKLMTGAIVPRPIAWVSTIDADGRPNLAPFSFFNAVCAAPPTVLFCPGIRAVDVQPKDTYHNVMATGEFVVNFVTEALAEQMNITATDVPAHVNEFERARLTPAASRKVRPPYVAESPIHFECTLKHILSISEDIGGGFLVLGTVVHMRFDDSIYREGFRVDFDAYRAVGRMAGAGYSRTTDRFDIERFPPEIRP